MPTAIEYLQLTTPTDREIRTERIFNAPRERVWKAITNPELIAQWWGRGNKLVIEKSEFHKGGHWRYVEHSPQGTHGFEGRYREIVPQERVVQTFEWDGMPGYVIIETLTLEDAGKGRTKLTNVSSFHTTQERDGMLNSGMADGMRESYEALEKLLAKLS